MGEVKERQQESRDSCLHLEEQVPIRSGLIGTTSRGWFYGHTYVLYVKLQCDDECFIKTTHFTILPLVKILCYNNVEQGQ